MRLDPVASFMAHVVFWILLPYGWWRCIISSRAALAFVLLWIIGYTWGLPPVFDFLEAMSVSYVAILDIVLVFLVFKKHVNRW